MKLLAVICLALVAYVHSATTPAALSAEVKALIAKIHEAVVKLFTTADLNNNGHFDTDDVRDIFEECDIDNNTSVTKNEFMTCFTSDAADLNLVAQGLFLDLDMDKNNILEKGDVQLYYDKLDSNDDGRVDKSEFVNYFQPLFEALFVLAIQGAEALKTTTPSS